MSEAKPDWWPDNPYPADVFTMTDAEYQAALPDHQQRSAISGYLGRLFWEIASDSIWRALQAAKMDENAYVPPAEPSRGPRKTTAQNTIGNS